LVLLSTKAGLKHICEKFPAALSIDHTTIAEQALPDAIRQTGDNLVRVDSKAKENELTLELVEQDSRVSALNKTCTNSNLHTRRPLTAGMEETESNQRIVLPSAKNISVFDPEIDNDEMRYSEVDAEEEISRDGIKRASSNIIAIEERRKLRNKKPEDRY